MTRDTNEMDLEVRLPAAELARLQRRIIFLEAAVVQMLRDDGGLKEWFSAAELAALRLPGVPRTRQGVARVAREGAWEWRSEHARWGDHRSYHFSSLPRLAFAAFIERVVKGGGDSAAADDDAASGADRAAAPPAGPFPVLAPVAPAAAAPAATTTPAWALPLLRLLKAGGGPLAHALGELPGHLPDGVACPSLDDARAMLARMGGTLGE